MKINETINSPNQSSRDNYAPCMFVLHIADGYYEGTKAWFKNPAAAVSSTYVIALDGRICQCVPLDRMAWCNGTSTDKTANTYFGLSVLDLVKQKGGNVNKYSISFEFEGFYSQTHGAITDEQLNAAAWLIQHDQEEVKRLYNVDIPADRQHIVGHFEVNPKTKPCCPGEKFPWSELMAKLQGKPTGASVLYRVQIGAFKDRANAEGFMKTVKAKGLEAFVTPQGDDGLYRVQVGAFSKKENAAAYQKEVKAKGFDAFVVIEEK